MTHFKKGDQVRIIIGPLDKIGREGIVALECDNGVIVQFEGGMATIVQDQHLALVEPDTHPIGPDGAA